LAWARATACVFNVGRLPGGRFDASEIPPLNGARRSNSNVPFSSSPLIAALLRLGTISRTIVMCSATRTCAT